MNRRILLVDDDNDILSGFQRNLRKYFVIKCASSGSEGLEIIQESEPFAVIVSDYKMPKMNGIEFLTLAKGFSPDSTRMMLTGYADVATAIEAVNLGNVFRFLTKPIATDMLIKSISDGVELYRLIHTEKELLEKTLKGSIKILIDILSMVNPDAFSKANRYRVLSRMVADGLGLKRMWEVEIAALLSQIGLVSIPSDIVEKHELGGILTSDEEKLFYSHPEYGRNLLKNIPRLEEIAVAIQYQYFDYSSGEVPNPISGDNIPMIARILKVVIDYDNLIHSGVSTTEALQTLAKNSFKYDPRILSVFEKRISGEQPLRVIIPMKFRNLKIGMELADDIKDESGNKLVKRGTEITDVILMRLINASKVREISEPIRVYGKSF